MSLPTPPHTPVQPPPPPHRPTAASDAWFGKPGRSPDPQAGHAESGRSPNPQGVYAEADGPKGRSPDPQARYAEADGPKDGPKDGRPARLRRLLGRVWLLAVVLLVAGCDVLSAPTTPRRDPTATEQPTPTPPPPILPGAGPHAAWATGSVEIFDQPGATTHSAVLPGTTNWGTTAVFAIRQARYDQSGRPWVEIMLPRRPNGVTAWAPATQFDIRPLTYEVEVSLSQRRLAVRRGAEVVRVLPVAIGAPDTPTPTGNFYITVKLQPPAISEVYGRWALGLSGFSDVLDQFGTGDGQIALHGTEAEWTIGQATSNGCVRLTNDAISELAELLPQGTPVTITA